MKKAIALLASLAFVPSLYAEMGDLDVDASYRVRAEYHDSYAGNTNGGSDYLAGQRFDFGATWRPSDKLTATLGMIFNSHWGDGVEVSTTPAIKDRAGYLQDLLTEANMTWMVTDELSLKVGRSYLTIGDGTIFHHNDWEVTPVHHDGVQVMYDSEFAKFNLFHSVAATSNVNNTPRGAAGANADMDIILNGLSVDVMALPEDIFTMANVLIYNVNDDINGTSQLNYSLSLGLTFVDMIDARLTYAMQTGEQSDTVDYEASMLDAEIGVGLPEVMGLRFFVGYHMDSGDSDAADDKNEEYNPYAYDMHANAGLMDIVRWGNLTDIYAGITLMPMDNMTAGLTYHMFSKTEKADAINAASNAAGLITNDPNEDEIGSEIDLYLSHSYEGGFSIMSRVSMFMPGKAWSTTNDETHTQLYLQGKLDF